MFLSSSLLDNRVVGGSITQHGEQDVAAAARKRDQSLVVTLALADFALVVGAGDGIAQCGKSREEQRALEYLVAAP